jgi:hypothetical protein
MNRRRNYFRRASTILGNPESDGYAVNVDPLPVSVTVILVEVRRVGYMALVADHTGRCYQFARGVSDKFNLTPEPVKHCLG